MTSRSFALSEKANAVLENQTVQWVILLIASFLVLFANAQAELTGGDAVLYAKEARLIAETGEYATFAIRSRAQSPRTAAILAHGLSHKDLGC